MKQKKQTLNKKVLTTCCITVLSIITVLGWTLPAVAQDEKPIKIGIVTYLSGGGAGTFGVSARNAAEVIAETLNMGGKVPAPYAVKGFGGTPIELTIIDEAGSVSKQVTEFRNLIERRNVDIVIGYASSANTLAIAPVAEELKKLTIIFSGATPRLFEEGSYKYTFRTFGHSTMDSVGLALYARDIRKNIKTIAGINPNYSWGLDSWSDFETSMKALVPGVQVAVSQLPKQGAGQYGAEISSLISSNADVIHTSLWGGDMEAFILQAVPRGLFKKSTVLLMCGDTALQRLGSQIPDGTVIGAMGPHSNFAPDNDLNRWFRAAYQERYSLLPTFPAYKMAQAIFGTKAAYEKAQAANAGKVPNQDQVIAALEYLTFETPSGKVEMSLGKGHQGVQGTAMGTVKHVKGQLTFTNVKHYPADQVLPPEGVKSADWIKSGFKTTK
jgi:branched-chain amino acid transport system substrate-binding protein